MPELGDELRLLADQGAQQAQPIPPAEVMSCGDRRCRRRGLRDGFAAVAVAGAVAVGVISGTPAGQHATLHHPETRPPAPLPSPGPTLPAPTPSPAPSGVGTPSPSVTPSPSPSSAPGQPATTPSPSLHPGLTQPRRPRRRPSTPTQRLRLSQHLAPLGHAPAQARACGDPRSARRGSQRRQPPGGPVPLIAAHRDAACPARPRRKARPGSRTLGCARHIDGKPGGARLLAAPRVSAGAPDADHPALPAGSLAIGPARLRSVVGGFGHRGRQLRVRCSHGPAVPALGGLASVAAVASSLRRWPQHSPTWPQHSPELDRRRWR